jgi:hypothetical protein
MAADSLKVVNDKESREVQVLYLGYTVVLCPFLFVSFFLFQKKKRKEKH